MSVGGSVYATGLACHARWTALPEQCTLCRNGECLVCTIHCKDNEYQNTKECKCYTCASKYGDKCTGCNDTKCTKAVDGYRVDYSSGSLVFKSCTDDFGSQCAQCTESKCTDVKAGYYMQGTSCNKSDCSSKIKECDKGYYCVGGAGTSGKKACPAGTYRNATKGAQESDCSNCPTGQFSAEGSTGCTRCEAGTYGVLDVFNKPKCETCPAGYSCSGGLNKVECPIGKYSSPGASECTSCPIGTYADSKKSASCKSCPAGYKCTPLNADGTVLMRWPNGKDQSSYIIPASIKVIGESAFGQATKLSSVTINENVQDIKSYAFRESGIVKIDIPNSVKTIGSAAFYGCRNLNSIILPEGLEKIEDGLINNCTSLVAFTIPSNVKYIGDFTFQGSENLCTITSLPKNPPQLGGCAFYAFHVDKVTLYVPSESVDAYKNAEGWNDFGAILPLESDIPQ